MVQWKKLLADLFNSQNFAVLATADESRPYCSLMAFAATGDLRYIFLATRRATRKYRNMTANPRVSLLVDNRSNLEADIHEALAVTVTGGVREVRGAERESGLALFLAKHPQLQDFIASPDCALMQVQVERYLLARRFQQVMEVSPG